MTDEATIQLMINSLNRIEGRVEGVDKKIQTQNVVIMRHTLALEAGTKEFESLHQAHAEMKDEIEFVRKLRNFVSFFKPTPKKTIFMISILTGGATLALKYKALIEVFK